MTYSDDIPVLTYIDILCRTRNTLACSSYTHVFQWNLR